MSANDPFAVNASAERIFAQLSTSQRVLWPKSRLMADLSAAFQLATSPFDWAVAEERIRQHVIEFDDGLSRFEMGIQRFQASSLLVARDLPKRGWYLSGQESCKFVMELAKLIRIDEWDKVDQRIMERLPNFQLDKLQEWLASESVPSYCVNRLCRFLDLHASGGHEEATYLGVPLLDEISLHLYGEKSFTTKSGSRKNRDQSKPELAVRTVNGPDLIDFCYRFVERFGSLHEDCDFTRLADENYWNRHAIVHGLMRRSMGAKDSAKCMKAIQFLFFARKDNEVQVE